jgi:hypothetical protein
MPCKAEPTGCGQTTQKCGIDATSYVRLGDKRRSERPPHVDVEVDGDGDEHLGKEFVAVAVAVNLHVNVGLGPLNAE